MFRRIIIAGALALAVAGPAAAQSGLLTDWGLGDMKTAFASVGAKVIGEGTDESGMLYLSGETAEGMKFLAYGNVCEGEPKRCKGVNFSAGFTQDNNAEVDRRVKEINRMAIGARNGGENSLDINRYVIFDDGITRANLKVNLEVFLGIAEDVWNGGGVD